LIALDRRRGYGARNERSLLGLNVPGNSYARCFLKQKKCRWTIEEQSPPGYRRDLSQTIRSGLTVDEVGATAIQDRTKRGVFVYNAIQPRPAARAQAVGFSSTYPWRIGIATTIFWVGEAAGAHNPVDNVRSAWDREWMVNYRGWTRQIVATGRIFVPLTFFKEYTRVENRSRDRRKVSISRFYYASGPSLPLTGF